jgi:ABC-type polysaccharide/polyol phosphate transport system ATPase subunit
VEFLMRIETADSALEVAATPTESEVVLSVEHLSKKYCRHLKRSLFYAFQDIAAELFARGRMSHVLRTGEFWALHDLSFQLRRGQALGLVGANGAGKTTLLRLISGLIRPDTGSIRIKGRVAPLIALGAGFNPILTGRENVYVNMSILGLSRQDIDDRFQDVLNFAEIGDAIDAPVRTYSSGMAARLGFACAIHTEPDILLVDEVLAVGDIKFRAKCYRQLAQLREKGTSFVLVSHAPQAHPGIPGGFVPRRGGKVRRGPVFARENRGGQSRRGYHLSVFQGRSGEPP